MKRFYILLELCVCQYELNQAYGTLQAESHVVELHKVVTGYVHASTTSG